MALVKLCSRTLTQRSLRQNAILPAVFSFRRNFSKQKSIKEKLDIIRDDFFDKNDELMRKVEGKYLQVTMKKSDKNEDILREPLEEHEQKVKKFKEKYNIDLESSESGDSEEILRPNDDCDDIPTFSDSSLYREKHKAADPGESYGPAKAEFDSWKRIYKEEEAFERLGLPPRAHYWRDGEMYSPFGILSNPVKVYSQFSHRIVGCRGGNGKAHEIVWINLGAKYKTMCPECGQMFMLVNYRPEEAEESEEDLHKLAKTANDGQLKEPQLY